MTGVSYMIPFVVAGGILIALAFAIGGAVEVTEVSIIQDGAIQFPGDVEVPFLTWLGAVLLTIGGTAFGMLVPILAGFIAYAMADRPGIAPGIVGGLIANEIGAGFLGGLIAGLLAGLIVNWLKKIPAKGAVKRMLPILVYPVLGTLAVGVLMVLVVGEPVASANSALSDWLNGLSGTNEILLGVIIGLMMAFDMGGPVNKVAYAFGIAALDAGNLQIMAAVMAAGMTPPLGMALATTLRPSLYNPAEKRAGEAAWLMGASFITEGAIPFAAADPLRVIPSLMAGSAVTGALSLSFNATLNAPHGGIWVVGLIGNAIPYLVAIAAGTLVTTILVNVLKGSRADGETAFKVVDVRERPETTEVAHA
jgi:PTS system fructose-specific IIC component